VPTTVLVSHAGPETAGDADDWSVADTALVKKYASQPGE
jgi:hypothetical protein